MIIYVFEDLIVQMFSLINIMLNVNNCSWKFVGVSTCINLYISKININTCGFFLT